MEKILLQSTGWLVLIVLVIICFGYWGTGRLAILIFSLFWLVVAGGWQWYFSLKVDFGRRVFLVGGVLLALLTWLIIVTIWYILGYGYFNTINTGDWYVQLAFYLCFTYFNLIVWKVWLGKRLSVVTNRELGWVLGSLLSALTMVLVGRIDAMEYVNNVLIWYVVYELINKYGFMFGWGVLIGWYFWNHFFDFFVVARGILVVGMPGHQLIILLVWLGMLLIYKDREKKIIGGK
ncbi:hypothetical protein KJ855_02440 [Patescibacteria group bacterium]|nr:hypothetical protein [Patescibacteria group bacterium]